GPPKEDPQEETYAQVKPFRLRTAGTVSPCVMSREFLDTNGGQAEEGREMDTQAMHSGGGVSEGFFLVWVSCSFNGSRQSYVLSPPPSRRPLVNGYSRVALQKIQWPAGIFSHYKLQSELWKILNDILGPGSSSRWRSWANMMPSDEVHPTSRQKLPQEEGCSQQSLPALSGTPVPTEAFFKPILRVQPDSVVYKQTAVTFICEGTTRAKEYTLYKERSQYERHLENPQNPKNKAEFLIAKIGQQHAGRYYCQYWTNDGWSEYSDALQLVVTGAYSKPSLSAQPSPVVTEGGMLTLQCGSRQQHDRFILTKEGPQRLSWTLGSQYNYHTQQYQAQFPVGPVTSRARWTFRCYSFDNNSPQNPLWSIPSEPLEIYTLGHILDPGRNLTLQCCSDINYDKFVLYKLDRDDFTSHDGQRTQAGLSCANFTLGPVSSSTAGQNRCYGAHNLSSEWSASSDPLDILITGQIPVRPSLSVKTNSTVHSGDNVTLLCQSPYKVDTFILSKEGAAHQPQRLKSKFQDQHHQAEFSMTAVTSALSGTYRCYGSQDSSLYLLSYGSAPMKLTVSEDSDSIPSTHMAANSSTASEKQDHTVENLIRMGFAAMILILLGILLYDGWYSSVHFLLQLFRSYGSCWRSRQHPVPEVMDFIEVESTYLNKVTVGQWNYAGPSPLKKK
ncbi:leukocyte immunoglobulin-like receptor subfamily B member 3, partial [Sigmodon hispidus]